MTTASTAAVDPLTEADELLSQLPSLTPTEQADVRREVICRCAPWAKRTAARYRHAGESMEDLTQVAMIGLILAVDRYDPRRRVPFRHFALPTITGELKKHFRDHGWGMRVGRRVKELYQEVHRTQPVLAQHLGRTPTDHDLAEYLELPEEDVRTARFGELAYRPHSLNATATGEEQISDTVGQRDPAIEAIADRDALQRALRTLPERLRTILSLRYVDELTQWQIADKVGLSQMHVSRLLARGLVMLRTHMEAEEPTRARS
jgi:RNA polymerase sigma-B factor